MNSDRVILNIFNHIFDVCLAILLIKIISSENCVKQLIRGDISVRNNLSIEAGMVTRFGNNCENILQLILTSSKNSRPPFSYRFSYIFCDYIYRNLAHLKKNVRT